MIVLIIMMSMLIYTAGTIMIPVNMFMCMVCVIIIAAGMLCGVADVLICTVGKIMHMVGMLRVSVTRESLQ